MSFRSYLGYTSGSGFASNQRPSIFYKPSLDLIDNPQFGLLLADSFTSQSKLHYQPPIHSDGSESLPSLLNKARVSGYHNVRTLSQTEPLEEKSEYRRLFVPHQLAPSVSHHMKLGPKLETGFTEGTNLQFNTFQDKKSGTVEPHQTCTSVMKSDFVSPSSLQVNDGIRGVRNHSCRETGYTRGGIAPSPSSSFLLPPSESKSNALVVKIGKKELTGFCLNTPNDIFPKTPYDPSHFTTHYKSKFCHDYQKDRKSVPATGVISTNRTMDNGYNYRDTDRFILKG